jgi:hypothetical protein
MLILWMSVMPTTEELKHNLALLKKLLEIKHNRLELNVTVQNNGRLNLRVKKKSSSDSKSQ